MAGNEATTFQQQNDRACDAQPVAVFREAALFSDRTLEVPT